MAAATQLNLLSDAPDLPEGLRYEEELISPSEQRDLVTFIETLPLVAFEFAGGFRGNRRVLSFGWRFDYSVQRLVEVSAIPHQLLSLRSKAAMFAGKPASQFEQVLVTEYAPGAGIGWHKDKAMFGDIVGLSLLVPCKFRLRFKSGNAWKRASFTAEPRSAYLLSGPARSAWEHSIPPMERLRYSVTFRNFLR
jgi:alkylated DNA repair dioxygenase AlkB